MNNWIYEQLLSCPAIMVLGHINIAHCEGIVLFPILNYRVNILSSMDEKRIINNIPKQLLPSKIEKICMNIAEGKIYSSDFLTDAIIKTMFYGGFNIFINRSSKAVPVVLDLINTSMYKFFLETNNVMIKGSPPTRLESWVVFATALRTGDIELFREACIDLKGEIAGEKCMINTPHGRLVVIPKDRFNRNELDKRKYIEIVPDNSPIRHVVKIDQ
ncbi:hypothetical protein [Staphylothermus hellenicus]|uniref:Uncharacterized protein n=1 Tax=Staphylothermus hellenicus (strain DSM 12710 / JCM 10830 / BK20S6-10-b1 / P8) TaxID=591019 RepID=D7DBF9_STAHD|nr:hypothetical protein [Staphylothermus hellenicus]ADI31506.1 hypothetical protein Shell_0374 [Staphylothermus hellenicus DSM 12710]